MSFTTLECPDVGCYLNFQCDPEYQNKIVAFALVKKSYTGIDKSTGDLWKQSLLDAYLEGEAFIVFNTSGEKPRPETATGPGRGMQTTKALAKTHTINVQDMQGVVQGNVTFYNEMLQTSQNYDLYYFTPGRIWDASGNYLTVIGDPVIGADLNTYQMAEVTITWTSKVNPLPYDFNTTTFLEGLFYEISSSTYPDFVISVAEGTTGTVGDWVATLNQSISGAQPNLVWSVDANSATIAALGLTVTPETGDFDLTDAQAGIYTFNLIVTNAFGCVFGTQPVTINVTPL